ncbi:MAG: sodium:solute symporter family protein [Flavobacteriales bacterium]|nr:sodium:solute symporter family protein [Flavobacteriales bacterium]
MGISLSSKNDSIEDYFLAKRKLPFWMLSITFIASWWGGGSAVDLVDLSFRDGISAYWIYGMPVLLATALMWVFATRIRKYNLTTQPEIMETRYNALSAGFLSVFILVFMLLGVATQAIVIGNFFESFLGLSYNIGVFVGVGLVVVYSSIGGFKGVVITDIIQFVFLLIATIVLFVVVVKNGAALSEYSSIFDSTKVDNTFSFTYKFADHFAYFITFGTSWVIQANVWQRIAATPKVGDANKMLAMSFFAFIPLYAIVTLTGVYAISIYDVLPQNGIVVQLIHDFLPQWAGALIFVGILAAIMSTMDSLLNTGSLVLSLDIFNKYIKPNSSQKQMVRFGRFATWLIALLSIFIAINIKSISKVSWIGSDFLTTGAFVPLILGFVWKKGNSNGAVASMIFGLLFSSYNLFVELDFLPSPPWEIASVAQALIGITTSAIIFVSVSLLGDKLKS